MAAMWLVCHHRSALLHVLLPSWGSFLRKTCDRSLYIVCVPRVLRIFLLSEVASLFSSRDHWPLGNPHPATHKILEAWPVTAPRCQSIRLYSSRGSSLS